MEKNIGGIEKVVRIVLGIVFVPVGLFVPVSGAAKVLIVVLSVGTLLSGVFCF